MKKITAILTVMAAIFTMSLTSCFFEDQDTSIARFEGSGTMDVLLKGKTKISYTLYFYDESKVRLEEAGTPSNILASSYTIYYEGTYTGDPTLSDTELPVSFTASSVNWDMSDSSSVSYSGTVTVSDDVATFDVPGIIVATKTWKRTR